MEVTPIYHYPILSYLTIKMKSNIDFIEKCDISEQIILKINPKSQFRV